MPLGPRYMVSVWTMVIVFLTDGHFAEIPIYNDACNETIFVSSSTNSGGKLVYSHFPTVSENRCNILIETELGYHIGYAFKQTTAFREIFIQNDLIFYSCTSVMGFGCGNSNFSDKLRTTRSNTLTLDVRGDDLSYFNFELVFFSFYYGKCNSQDVRCDSLMGSFLSNNNFACMDRGLACDNTYSFCDTVSSRSCGSDIIAGDFNFKGSLIAAITLLCIIIVPLITMSACIIYRKYCKRREPVEDTPTRARRIFAEILAEAQENAGYDTGPIDPSKFDPPPEYGSLEQLDGAGSSTAPCDKRLSQIAVECPPCYNDVMSNSTEYLVSGHI